MSKDGIRNARADYDLEVNLKAEKEIEVVLQHLEYQNTILIAMVEKLGVSFNDTASEIGAGRNELQKK
jgi:uncharacterized membrane protein